MASPLKVKQSVVISAVVVVVSAVAHSLVLWMPVPETRQPAAPSAAESEPEDMSVVILPQSEDTPAPPAPEPPPPTAPAPAPAIAPPPAPEPALLPTDVIPESAPPPVSPLPSPAQPESSPAPPPDDLPIADGATTPAFSPPPNDGPLLSYGDRFPHFEGAVGGCFGLSECRQVSGVGKFRDVARSLIAGLEDQGYRVQERDDLENDSGRNVYELTPPGNDPPQQFLMVFSGADGSAIYVMSPEIMTLEELQALAAQRESNRLPV